MIDLSVSRLRGAKSRAVHTAKRLALVGLLLGLVTPVAAAAATRMFTYRGIANFQADNGAPPMFGMRSFVARFAYAADQTPLWSDFWLHGRQRWSTDCSQWECNPLDLSMNRVKSAASVSDEELALIAVTSPSGFGGHDPWMKPFSYALTPADSSLAGIWFVHPQTGGWYVSSSASITSFSVTSVPEPASWGLMLIGFGGIGAALRVLRRAPVTSPAESGIS